MNGIIKINEIKELFRSEKSIKIILIAGAVIILLIAFSGFSSDSKSDTGNMLFEYKKQAEYEEALERKLAEVLSEIEGIGNINIMITLDSSEENMYEKNNDEPTYVKMPVIRGVIVVCDGGDNIIVREKVITAVAGAFGISTTRISVIR